MLKLDHLRLPVTDLARSRAWYVGTLGLSVEFELPDRHTVALQDTADFTVFLQEAPAPVELRDPDGYRIRLWDERSMKER